MSPIKIYAFPASAFSLRVIATCKALELSYELVLVDLLPQEHKLQFSLPKCIPSEGSRF